MGDQRRTTIGQLTAGLPGAPTRTRYRPAASPPTSITIPPPMTDGRTSASTTRPERSTIDAWTLSGTGNPGSIDRRDVAGVGTAVGRGITRGAIVSTPVVDG